jgi:hypothetical protein
MRFNFFLVPVAVAGLIAPVTANADTYLTAAEAQQIMFPGASFAPADFTLSDQQMGQLQAATGSTVFRAQVKMWRVSTGGWFFLDQVPGRDDRITYAVGLDREGKLKSIEILVCSDEYDQVRNPGWRHAFVGKMFRKGDHLSAEIPNLSGTTLSSAHITDGVTRVLATYAMFVAPRFG